MAKTNQQKLDAYFEDREKIRTIVKNFVNETHSKFKTNSYAAGYLETFSASLLMELPKTKRKEYLNQLQQWSTHWNIMNEESA